MDELVAKYNCPAFIPNDPVSIPHRYTRLQDVEISGLIAAVLAWGNRATIIRKCQELMELMDDAPYEFVMGYEEQDLKRLQNFKHRTFQPTDLFYFIHWFRWYFSHHESLEDAFARFLTPDVPNTGPALIGFHDLFFSLPEAPERTRKHIATPVRKSTCKRMNMFLRWMVRQDHHGVDFGVWKRILPAQLLCPIDLHVNRIARRMHLLTRKQTDWQATLELTQQLRVLSAEDPVQYDFALFGWGVEEKVAGKQFPKGISDK